LVEHDKRPPVRGSGKVPPVRFRERLRFERRALMNGVGSKQPIEVTRRDALDWWHDLAKRLPKPSFRIFGKEQTQDTARGVPEGGFDGVKPEKPDWPVFFIGTVTSLRAMRFCPDGRIRSA
jgi:hypothetical protein